jgi:hypothetical protein
MYLRAGYTEEESQEDVDTHTPWHGVHGQPMQQAKTAIYFVCYGLIVAMTSILVN